MVGVAFVFIAAIVGLLVGWFGVLFLLPDLCGVGVSMMSIDIRYCHDKHIYICTDIRIYI